MITIKTEKVKTCSDDDEMRTTVEIEGKSTIIKEEIKALLQHCEEDEVLRYVVICAIKEVLHDN